MAVAFCGFLWVWHTYSCFVMRLHEVLVGPHPALHVMLHPFAGESQLAMLEWHGPIAWRYVLKDSRDIRGNQVVSSRAYVPRCGIRARVWAPAAAPLPSRWIYRRRIQRFPNAPPLPCVVVEMK